MSEVDEYENMVSLINVFQVYYRNLFNKKENETLFEDINYKDPKSTNRSMELLYDEMYKYKINQDNPELITVYDIDQFNKKAEDCEELYILMIDNKENKICETLFPLISYMSRLEWTNINWSINSLKQYN